MPSPDVFLIVKRQYDIIIKQALDNLPQESGGFIGGRDNIILGIMPTVNQHLGNRTDTFAVTSSDIQRAYDFFKKNGLTFFGLYHSHPKGIAYPSQEDILTGQRYHFIISLQNPKSPVLAAYEIIKQQPHQIPIRIELDEKFLPKSDAKGSHTPPPHINSVFNESGRHLDESLTRWREEKKIEYPKMPPKGDLGDFSTLA
ncbi:hypothetical protein EB093_01365 [bacterium]|nr:hypothetical protein [bacterium]